MAKRQSSDHVAIPLPTIRSYRVWSPAQLRLAEAQADAGHVRLAVDICEWLLGDDKVRGAIDGRVGSFLAFPLKFEPDGDRRRSGALVKALESGDWDRMFQDAEVEQILRWGILLGFAPFVNRWYRDPRRGDRDLPRVEFYHPQPFSFDQKAGWSVALDNVKLPVTPGDGVWGMHCPFGAFRPWSLGLWRGLAPWVLLKSYAISDFGAAGEGASTQVVQIDKDVKSGREQRKELAEALGELSRHKRVVLPPGFSYKLVEASAATKDLYDKQIHLADNAIAIALRGANLTTDVGTSGSRAAAEVHERSGDLVHRRKDASAWSTTTHDHVLEPWATSNWTDATEPPWATWETEPGEDRKIRAETVGTAMESLAKAQHLGFRVKRRGVIESFDLGDLLEEGEDIDPPEPADNDDDDDDDEGEGEADAQARARARPRPRTATGFLASKASGFLNGQLYVDKVVDKAAEASAAAMQPTVEAILEELDAAEDYEDLRERLHARFAGLDADGIEELTYRALVMAELAGSAAVLEDQ